MPTAAEPIVHRVPQPAHSPQGDSGFTHSSTQDPGFILCSMAMFTNQFADSSTV